MIDKRDQRPLPRPRYEERLRPFAGTQLIKVLVGQRRVGKSWLLRGWADQLSRQRPGVPQVFLVAEPAKHKREFENLLEIEDNHPKLVVSMDPAVADFKGVKHLRLRAFLRDGWRE